MQSFVEGLTQEYYHSLCIGPASRYKTTPFIKTHGVGIIIFEVAAMLWTE